MADWKDFYEENSEFGGFPLETCRVYRCGLPGEVERIGTAAAGRPLRGGAGWAPGSFFRVCFLGAFSGRGG